MEHTKKHIYRFMQSFVALPIILATSVSPLTVVNTVQSVDTQSTIVSTDMLSYDERPEVMEARAKAIDTFYTDRDMPLAGYGKKMVEEALKNDIDWRLLAAIAVRESTGGKHACKYASYSTMGYGSCKINFKSTDHEIEVVARTLGGNSPKTAHRYDNKTTKEILEAYNPPSVIPKYAQQVMKIMDTIDNSIEIDAII